MTMSREEYIFTPYKVIQVKYKSADIPRPRSGHRITCDDSNIYCFGGYNPYLPLHNIPENPTWSPDKPLFRELWSFSIAKNEWKHHRVEQNMPEELASNAMCMYGKYLLIFGGTGAPFGIKCSNDVIVWRTGSSVEADLNVLNATGVRPPGQYGQAIFCYKNHFYAVGGTNGFAYNCDIYRLNLQTMVWEFVYVGSGQDDEPMGRYRHEVIRVNTKLYIIGGGTGEWAFELMEIPMFDLETRTWTLLTPKADENSHRLAPLPRKCHSAVAVHKETGTQIFVVGGTDGQSVFEDVWRLDINTLQWTLMQKSCLPHPLFFHSSTATSSGCMYVFGGIEPKEEPASRNNTMYKIWLCIPKLSEICWEAMLHYNPDLCDSPKKELLASGIPQRFVERLV